MGNKRLKKREHSLKGLGRRGLSLLMAMVMTLSLVQISAFATDEEKTSLNPTPDGITDSNGVKIKKSAKRMADDEWQVTVEATVGEKPIQQQPWRSCSSWTAPAPWPGVLRKSTIRVLMSTQKIVISA